MLPAALRPNWRLIAQPGSTGTMKTQWSKLALLALLVSLLQGCVAFPPLIQVEHKYPSDDQELMKRLDAIDKRLEDLEKKETK